METKETAIEFLREAKRGANEKTNAGVCKIRKQLNSLQREVIDVTCYV
jgi:hypothetical protein